ncbi:hypothetical protein JL721_11326 [Aureococcus anophagefferens]|nr:hypothetical protein JL721_11326 [Aureococcus anophagefferens]
MAGRKVAISNCARALNDNEIYIIQIFDNAPSGLLVKAYLQAKSLEYFMPITEGELEKAALNRGEAALTRLAESIDLVEKGGAIFLESSIPGIAKPKVFIGRTRAGDGTLPAFLAKALAELCRDKPAGLEAVKRLGEWMLEHNPNQPAVDEPEDGPEAAVAAAAA